MRLSLALLLIFIAVFSPSAHAAFGDGQAKQPAIDTKDPLSLNARFQPSMVEPGGSTELFVDMTLAPGFHAYLERFRLSIESPDDLKLAAPRIAPTVKFFDTVSKSQKDGVEGRASLKSVVEVPQGFRSGAFDVKLKLVYQACTEDYCLLPKTKIITAQLSIGPVITAPGAKLELQPAPSAAKSGEFHEALKKGTLSAFLLVFVVGFLTSLTPCIYPMIPITLAVLGARAKNHSHLKNFTLALTYVFGIAITYALLGVAAASTGGLFGAALANPWVVSTLALVFVAMALSMFGLFELQAPAFVRDRLGSARTSSGYGGAFTTGLLAGIVASPCVGPVLVSVLTYIAQTQNRALGFGLLFVFAFGLGLPFLVLGVSSSWLSKLPKAGGWMEGVKHVFGVVMLGMAFYYVRFLLPDWLMNVLMGLTLVALASHFGAFDTGHLNAYKRLRKGFMLAALAVGTGLTTIGVLKKADVDLTKFATSTAATEAPKSAMKWRPYSDASLDEALAKKEPVMIDFGAEWCGACKEMDATTFMHQDIIEATRGFALLRVDGTEETPELKRLIAKFNVQGFPTYLFYDRQGKLREELTLTGMEEPELFKKRISATLR